MIKLMGRVKAWFCSLGKKETETCLYWVGMIVAGMIALIYAGAFAFEYLTGLDLIGECRVKQTLGIPCPGCGGTRAVIALFSGHLWKSLYFNAFATYACLVFVAFYVTQTLQMITKGKIPGMKFRDMYWQAGIVILIIQYVLKLVIPGYLI